MSSSKICVRNSVKKVELGVEVCTCNDKCMQAKAAWPK